MAEVLSFSPIRMTAATEEAAVQQALQIVGADRENVSVEVVGKDAKGITVRVSPRREGEPETVAAPAAPAAAVAQTPAPVETAPAAAEIEASDEPEAETAAPARRSSTRSRREPRAAAAPTAEAAQPRAEGDNGAEGDEEAGDEALTAAASEPHFGVEPIVHAPIDPALQQLAVDTAQDMLDRMGMDAQCHVAPGGQENGDVPRLMLEIDGEDVGILIGKHGQTLQAFQYLLNITLNNGLNGAKTEENGRENSLRVVVDAGGYRSRRAGSLQQVARDAAQRAVRDRRPVRMEPMPAHERRLVHMALQNDTSVTTGSDGREPMRFVVISPAGYRAPEGGEREGGRGYGGRSGGRGGFAGGRSGNRDGGGGGYRGNR